MDGSDVAIIGASGLVITILQFLVGTFWFLRGVPSWVQRLVAIALSVGAGALVISNREGFAIDSLEDLGQVIGLTLLAATAIYTIVIKQLASIFADRLPS